MKKLILSTLLLLIFSCTDSLNQNNEPDTSPNRLGSTSGGGDPTKIATDPSYQSDCMEATSAEIIDSLAGFSFSNLYNMEDGAGEEKACFTQALKISSQQLLDSFYKEWSFPKEKAPCINFEKNDVLGVVSSFPGSPGKISVESVNSTNTTIDFKLKLQEGIVQEDGGVLSKDSPSGDVLLLSVDKTEKTIEFYDGDTKIDFVEHVDSIKVYNFSLPNNGCE